MNPLARDEEAGLKEELDALAKEETSLNNLLFSITDALSTVQVRTYLSSVIISYTSVMNVYPPLHYMFKFIKLYYLVPKFFLPIAPTCSNPFKVTSPNLLTLSGISTSTAAPAPHTV